ncbi:uncharacterized protein RSE6_01477 [Rhynchosporium secalis]|uniref:Zn(2)-C6 fungal-type domain-containing protein n=1 Tax=Rhynchosporium secalis TaxID=38038 RepID=A0A1E1LXV8_RHYSE|nr:uncharacterized protein RSE6_01477 [Rhynchosporium secalis]
MATNMSSPRPRPRATLACEMCRSRRTKCDGRKPTCSFCDDHNIPCKYRDPAAPASSKTELEIQAIKLRLEDVFTLVSMQSLERLDPNTATTGFSVGFAGNAAGSIYSGRDQYPMDESIISRTWRMEFPFMLIQTQSTMCLLGQDPMLSARMVVSERTDLATLTLPSFADESKVQYGDAISVFAYFYDRMQHWYPVLHQDFLSLYLEKLGSELSPSADYCLALIVAAIGSVCRCASFATAYTTRPDAKYIGKALTMIPFVNLEFSLRSAQCLLFLAVYYNSIGKPCQAHDYILMASCKAQALFKCQIYHADEESLTLLRLVFWSTLLIETELGYHMDMPESNVWKFDDRILLPSIHDSWEPFRENQRYMLEQARPQDSLALTSNDTKAYFLAAISMCRMMRRCFASVVLFNHKEVYAPIIANELTNQLVNWHESLPSSLKFNRRRSFSFANAATPTFFDVAMSSSSRAAIMSFLEMQFYQCLISTYWPAVYSVLYLDTVPDTTLVDCLRFFEAYVGLVSSIVSAIKSCPHTPWNFYASLFITTMAAHKGAQATCLRGQIPEAVISCFEAAKSMFESGEAVINSPSLAMLGAILSRHIKTES